MIASTVAAIDLGASSGRVVVGRIGPAGASLQEVHRFANQPVRVAGALHWDVLALYRGVLEGLRRAEDAAGPLDAVGVDSWAVDYGLLDARGHLIGNPVHYRDGRTAGVVADVLNSVGAATLYQATGIQQQPFNTVFQLLADGFTAMASTALLIPDLINYWLCGVQGTEVTNASTTALLDPRTQQWAAELAQRLGIRTDLFPALHQPGTVLGAMLPQVCAEAGLSNVPKVIAVPSHDTAAAVAGVPAESDAFAYVCTGTWALVGVELGEPVISEAGRAANFTNELGADGTVRYLRNVTGFWLLQECVRTWQASGEIVNLDDLTAAAADETGLTALIDVQDPQFAAPGDMPARIVRASTGSPSTHAQITRCILDSMALAVRRSLRDVLDLSGRSVDAVHVVGGGVANAPFCQLVADACQLPVLAGPTEAASWGNAVSQAQALGVVPAGLAAARAVVRDADKPLRYVPRANDADWVRAEQLLSG